MGISQYMYIGPYIRLTSSAVVEIDITRSKCKTCNCERNTKFCSECGALVETVTIKGKKKTISDARELVNYLRDEHDMALDMFLDYEYTSGCLLSEDIGNTYDIDEDFVMSFDKMSEDKDDDLDVFSDEIAELVEFMNNNKIQYEVNYGIVFVAS